MTVIGDLAELNILLDTPNGRKENVLGFEATATTASLAGLANDFDTNFLATWAGLSTTQVSCSRLDVVDVKPGVLATVVHPVSPSKNGTSAGDPLPFQDAGVISWRSDLKGRSFRGRSFILGFTEAQQANGIWSAALQTALDTMLDNFLARYGLADPVAHWRFVVISRFANGAARVSPIGTHITGASFSPFVFTQRRRGAGRS